MKIQIHLIIPLAILTHLLFSIQVSAEPQFIQLSGQLNERIVERGFFQQGFFRVTQDGTLIVYRGLTSSSEADLYVVGADGSNPRILLKNSTVGRIFKIKVSNNSKTLVAETQNGLYSVKLADSSAIRLDSEIGAEYIFEISPDSRYVVYAKLFGPNFYSVPIDGGDTTQLNNFVFSSTENSNFTISPDSKYVTYKVLENLVGGGTSSHLFVTPIDGGANTSLLPSGMQDLLAWKVTSDSQFVIYSTLNSHIDLFSIKLDGSNRSKITPESDTDQGLLGFEISPNGKRIAFSFKQSGINGKESFFLSNLDGSNLEELMTGKTELKSAGNFRFTSDLDVVFSMKTSVEAAATYFFETRTSAALSTKALNSGNPIVQPVLNSIFHGPSNLFLIYSRDKIENDRYSNTLLGLPLGGGNANTLLHFDSPDLGCSNEDLISTLEDTITYCTDFDGDGKFNVDIMNLKSAENPITRTIIDQEQNTYFYKLTNTKDRMIYISNKQDKDSSELDFTLNSIRVEDLGFNDAVCTPIKAKSGNISVICL